MVIVANTGLGLETAKECARNEAKIILTCRDWKKTQEAVDTVNVVRAGSAEYNIGLGDMTSVGLFANEFKAKYTQLDILINNASVMHIPQRMLTKD